MSKRYLIHFILSLVCLCAVSCNEPQALPAKGPPPSKGPPAATAWPVNVEVRGLELRPFKVILSASGVTSPYRVSKVAAAVSGRIAAVRIHEGQKIKKGEELAIIDDRLWLYRVQEQEAECRRLQAELDRLTRGYLPEEIKAQQQLVQENESQLQSLAAELKRKTDLYQNQNLSRTEWDEIRYAHEAQKARLDKAKSELALLERGYREELRAAALAELKKSEAQLSEEKYFLGQASIVSPFDGLVLAKNVEEGEWVVEGSPVASIIQTDRVKVVVFVPERYISLVKTGETTADIAIDALPHKKNIVGKVLEVVPQASAKDRNFEVHLLLENPDGEIKSGMSCRVSAIFKDVPHALMIHRDAFFVKDNRTFSIKVAEGNRARYVAITVGQRDGDWFEVLDSRELLFDVSHDRPVAGPYPQWRLVRRDIAAACREAIKMWLAQPTPKYRMVQGEKSMSVYSPEQLHDGDKVVVTNNPNVDPGSVLIITREYQ